MTTDNRFDARLDLVPTSPGVYLMKDASGSVIYVGKAINLRQRLRSYFGPNPQGNEKVLAMISHIRDYSYLLCANELETLILESNLIKRYMPFYNILLKDDRDYPYIRVTLNELYPRIMKAYRIGPDEKEGAKYYGPYLNGDLWQALRTIHELFPLKTCKRVFPRDIGKERPCLNYYMNTCIGPCLGTVSADAYREVVQGVCDFLEGHYDGIYQSLKQEMTEASDRLDFERAAVLRDRIQTLTKLNDKQVAVLDTTFDGDALGLARNNAEVCVLKLEVRRGKITGTSTYFIDAPGSEDDEILTAFMEQYYPGAANIPPIILVSAKALASIPAPSSAPDPAPAKAADRALDTVDSADTLTTFLSELAGRKVRIHNPQRGEKRDILRMADENAAQQLKRRTIIAGSNQQSIDEALQLLAQLVGLKYPPARIEAYDISNTGKDDIACGMAVFENGRSRRGQSRLFNIRNQEGQDDYSAMAQALDRRLSHLGDEQFGMRPDLILLDGGLGHVHAMMPVLATHKCEDIALAGMVKDKRHRTRGLVLANGQIIELEESLGLINGERNQDSAGSPDVGAAVAMFSGDPSTEREEKLALLRLLSAIQNETHRLANKANKNLNKKRQTRYKLEEIPGIGPAKRKALLQAFRTMKELAAFSEEDILAKAPSIGAKAAHAVYTHFHGEGADSDAEVSGEEEA